MKGRSASKIKLTSYDELLGGGEETNDIQQVSLEHLHSFENHPFQVNDDEAMTCTGGRIFQTGKNFVPTGHEV